MSTLIVVSIFLLFNADSTLSLPKSAIRELIGLDSKVNHFPWPGVVNGTIPNVFPNISKACKMAFSELTNSSLVLAACKYDFVIYACHDIPIVLFLYIAITNIKLKLLLRKVKF